MTNTLGKFDLHPTSGKFLLDDSGKFKICGDCCPVLYTLTPCPSDEGLICTTGLLPIVTNTDLSAYYAAGQIVKVSGHCYTITAGGTGTPVAVTVQAVFDTCAECCETVYLLTPCFESEPSTCCGGYRARYLTLVVTGSTACDTYVSPIGLTGSTDGDGSYTFPVGEDLLNCLTGGVNMNYGSRPWIKSASVSYRVSPQPIISAGVNVRDNSGNYATWFGGGLNVAWDCVSPITIPFNHNCRCGNDPGLGYCDSKTLCCLSNGGTATIYPGDIYREYGPTKCPGGNAIKVTNDLSAYVGRVVNIGGTCYSVSIASDPTGAVTLSESIIAAFDTCHECCQSL